MNINTVKSQRRVVINASLILIVFVLFIAFLSNTIDVSAFQADFEIKPVDMMLVIDNSCSMFPKELWREECWTAGNDKDFLRIAGAHLFIAKLGFAENNASDFQAGVVSLGENSRLISPLQPLSVAARDSLAGAIKDPSPEPGTQIIPALEVAYQELRTSPNRRPENLPAVVLITDGAPFPCGEQSNEEIERLASDNSDISLFIMLLQNPAGSSEADDCGNTFEEYIQFWQDMQRTYEHVYTYPIENVRQVEETYNKIRAVLEDNIIPDPDPISIDPGVPYAIFVDKYVRRFEVTVIHEDPSAIGKIVITDPAGNEVGYTEGGVKHFSGVNNPVEIISVAAPRLSDDLKDQDWIITSDQPVEVIFDRQGAYRINFVEPKVTSSDLPNLVFATEQHVPGREFVIKFNLLDQSGEAVLEHQLIQGRVINPEGEEVPLTIAADLAPDANGVYEIGFNPLVIDPAIQDRPGKFTIIVEAGSATPAASEQIPIANARLVANIGRAPFIDTVVPEPVVCADGQPADITVTIGDIATALPNSLQVRLFGDGADVALTSDGGNTFSADITDICTSLIAGMTCGTPSTESLRIRLTGSLEDGSPMPINEREVETQIIGPACPTATLPPPPPTPTPTPTPIPDSDGDGWNDVQDACPSDPGWDQFDGCPPPWWFWLLVVLGVLLLAALAKFLFPFLMVRISPPPRGFVLVCKKGDRHATAKSTYNEGMARRTNRVTIGGDRNKACIYVAGLKDIEFVVVKEGEEVVLLSHEKGTTKRFSDRSQTVSTSQADTTLRISLAQEKVSKC